MNDYVAGSTSVVEVVDILDSTSTTGGFKTGLTYTDVTCYYKRSNGTASVQVSLANITTLGTFVSGGFREIDSANQPGLYEFHPPDASVASGAKWVVFTFTGSGMVLRRVKYRILAVNPDDAVRMGLTALPNVASGNAGALLIDGTGTAAISNSAGKVLLQATQAGVTIPTVTTLTNATTDAAAIRSAIGMASANLDTQLAAIAAAGSGDGSVLVDQDYGGTNNLAAVDENGAGINNCTIRAYLKSDYDAGNTGAAYVVASTVTTVGGAWSVPMALDPAVYTLVYSAQESFESVTQEVTVT